MKARCIHQCFFLLSLLFVLCLGACEPGSGKKEASLSGGRPAIGILAYRKNDIYVELVSKAMQEALKDRASVELLFAESDQLTQNEQIKSLLQKGLAGLAVNIVETQAAARAVDHIKKADIPVVFFNREPELNSLKAYAKARFVGTRAEEAGLLQGEIIVDLWRTHPNYDKNGDGTCQYLMLQGTLDNPEALARTEYSVRQARELGLNMRQVGSSLLCDWDEERAYEALSRSAASLPGIELIIANNDSMALGAIRALREYGYNQEGGGKFIPVVGVDAVPRAVEAIRQGSMSGTVEQDGKAMGEAVAAMLMNAIENKDFLSGLPYTWDASGIAVRIPYARHTGAD